jgi:uncharacterized membrane protein
MADFESMLERWQRAGVLDAETAGRIRAYERTETGAAGANSKRVGWQVLVALILGALLLGCGVVLFVSAHWDQMGPGARYALAMAMVGVFHLGGSWARASFRGLSTALHAVGTIGTGAAIALVGQIFNIQEHWPAAILLWAVAAAVGWALLRDEAQQVLTLLLFPAWLFCEFTFAAQNEDFLQTTYVGRFLIVWAMLYLTVFLGSKRKIARGILFAISSIACVVGIFVLLQGWHSWGDPNKTPFALRAWGWVDIAVLPLLFAAIKFRKSVVPVSVGIVFSIALPWCHRVWNAYYDPGDGMYHNSGGGNRYYASNDPTLAAHALVTGFAVFVIWWGVRQASKALVNLGMVGFAIAVAWFYFSDIFDKVGRSLGLIGLGVLFLAGGWALERMRRGLIAGMCTGSARVEAAR